MFQFRAFPAYTYLIQCTLTRYCRAGFPHSEISGSMRMCRSPELIAACRVLLRLLMPRHSPCALISLTIPGSQELCRSQKILIARIVVCYPIPQLSFRAPFRALPSVALLLSSSFPLFSFQGADEVTCVPSKLNKASSCSARPSFKAVTGFQSRSCYDFLRN